MVLLQTEKHSDGGRVLSKTGRKDLDRIASAMRKDRAAAPQL